MKTIEKDEEVRRKKIGGIAEQYSELIEEMRIISHQNLVFPEDDTINVYDENYNVVEKTKEMKEIEEKFKKVVKELKLKEELRHGKLNLIVFDRDGAICCGNQVFDNF